MDVAVERQVSKHGDVFTASLKINNLRPFPKLR